MQGLVGKRVPEVDSLKSEVIWEPTRRQHLAVNPPVLLPNVGLGCCGPVSKLPIEKKGERTRLMWERAWTLECSPMRYKTLANGTFRNMHVWFNR